jgi:hypothetical protein
VVWRGVPAWLGAGLVSAFAFWTLTALARADVTAPGTSRYLYPSAVFVLLVLAALPDGDGGWRGWRGWLGRRRSTWVLAALVVGWAALANVDPLRDGGRHLRSATGAIAPSLAAIEIGGDAIAAGERPQPQYAPQVGAGAYLDAVEEFGSALPDGAAGELGSAGDAAAVDAALQALEHIVLADGAERAAVGAPAPTVVQALGGRARRAGGCVRFAPRVQPAALDVEAPTGTALVVRNRGGTTAEVRLRRYGPDFPPQALGVIPPNAERALSLPSDSRGEPWVARISAAQPVTVCRAG